MKERIYDHLGKKVKSPAVLSLGERCVAGRWIPLGEVAKGVGPDLIVRSKSMGIEVLAEGSSWHEVAKKLGMEVKP